MSRFWDDLDLIAPEDYVPTMAQTLLAHLHLHDAPREQQEAGISDWIKTHPVEPGSMMAYTLQRRGFGQLLGQPATA